MQLEHVTISILALFVCCQCRDTSWTWLSGDKSVNSLLTKTNPGGRSGAAYWIQSDLKAVWIFGGEHHKEHSQPQLSNDLWKLDLGTNKWELVHNRTATKDEVPEPRQLAAGCGVLGAYFILFGGLGDNEKVLGDTWLYYIPDNKWHRLDSFRSKIGYRDNNGTKNITPGLRGDGAVWCHRNDHLIIFGGFGENGKLLHDLWMFDLEVLSWKQAESSSKLPPDSEFIKHLMYPNGRSGATTWEGNNMLYMFGGNSVEGNARSKHVNIGNIGDMWRYDWSQDNWTHLSGDDKACSGPGNYGSYGAQSLTNQPGCRRKAAGWVDGRDNLWMFGGDGIDGVGTSPAAVSHSKLLSDLWYFNTASNQWTWMGGEQVGDKGGNYGDAGDDLLPGSRCEVVVWSVLNIFYLYGGLGHDSNGQPGYLNDVWKLDIGMSPFIRPNAIHPVAVFAVIISGIVLVLLFAVLYFCVKGYLQEPANKEATYDPLVNGE